MFSRLRFLGRAGPLNVAGGLPDSRGVGNSGVPNSLGRSRQIGLCSGHFCRSDDRMALPLVHFCGVATRIVAPLIRPPIEADQMGCRPQPIRSPSEADWLGVIVVAVQIAE